MKKVILITGGSSSLSKSIAKNLKNRDYQVYLSYKELKDVDNEKIQGISSLVFDITDFDACQKAVGKIIKENGRIDALINVAGISVAGPSLEKEGEEFLKSFNVNVLGQFFLAKSVVPYMVKQSQGKIINITSMNGLVSMPNFGLYSATKFAAQALGESLRYELKGNGIWVTNVAPGAIKREAKIKVDLIHKPAREKFPILKILMPFTIDDKVSKKVIEVFESCCPPPLVIVGNDAKIVYALKRFLPSFLWDRLMRFIWYKK